MTAPEEVTTAEKLRTWARGWYPNEAAVELLIRAFGGRFARDHEPWIITAEDEHGQYARIDPDLLMAHMGALSGGEQRLLLIVASLLDRSVRLALGDVIPGIDRDNMALVLAALSHANGSHEHSAMFSGSFTTPGPLYPWPGEGS